MCTLLLSYKNTPGYRLIVAANRDEFINRLTAPLSIWQEDTNIVAGRDLQAGGTWLGLTTNGRFAAITNYREPQKEMTDFSSRGNILVSYLKRRTTPFSFLQSLQAKTLRYKGFNLLLGDKDTLYSYSNRSGTIQELKPGIYGLSNHLLDSPWPKIMRGKKRFSEIIKDNSFNREEFFTLLQDNHQPADNELPDTGVGQEWERLLSSLFISSESYGTRSSAVITMRDNGQMEFTERTYSHYSDGWGQEGEISLVLKEKGS